MRILILALLCPCMLLGQEPVDATTFFSIGMARAKAQTEQNQKKVNFPWIEEYDVRTETRDLDPAKQEYTLRLSPSSPGRRKALKDAYNHMLAKPDFEGEEVLCDRRMDIHLDWLALYVIQQQLESRTAYQTIMADKQAIMEKSVGTYEFDVKKLVRLEMEKNDLSVDIYTLEQQAQEIAVRYGVDFSTLDFTGFIGVGKIKNTLNAPIDSQAIVDAEIRYKEEEVQRELAIERSDNRQYLDFLQFRYQGPHDDLLKERVSIGLGFNIPNSGDRKLKIQELELERGELAREADLKADKQSERLFTIKKELQSEMEALDFQQTIAAQERARLDTISSMIMEKEGFDPLLVLEIEERAIQLRLVMLQKQESIYVDYLKYLKVSQQMCGSERIFLKE